jgi:hypothetical protein
MKQADRATPHSPFPHFRWHLPRITVALTPPQGARSGLTVTLLLLDR